MSHRYPFGCTWPGCQYRAIQRGRMTVHLRCQCVLLYHCLLWSLAATRDIDYWTSYVATARIPGCHASSLLLTVDPDLAHSRISTLLPTRNTSRTFMATRKEDSYREMRPVRTQTSRNALSTSNLLKCLLPPVTIFSLGMLPWRRTRT